jgi:hypothetical protein
MYTQYEEIGGEKCIKTFEIHCRANNVEVFENTEKLKHNSSLAERFCLFVVVFLVARAIFQLSE